MEVRVIQCSNGLAQVQIWNKGVLATTLEVWQAFETTKVKTTLNLKSDDQTHEFVWSEK